MFNKKSGEKSEELKASDEQPQQKKAPTVGEVRRREISVIGPTLRFKGELSANEDLVIEGRVEGRIAHQEKNLTIGKQGKVHADIHARVVDILGEVEGDVVGDELVRLKDTAVVKGNIKAPRVSMEEGAFFSGSVEMARRDEKGEKAVSSKENANQPKLAIADSSSAQAPSGGA